jgi:Trypsin-like peptidase domain
MNKYALIFFQVFFAASAFCQTNAASKMSNQELLINSTIRLYCEHSYTDSTGKKKVKTSTGTGFFFNFKIDSLYFVFIVTNKHVVSGYERVSLEFKKASSSGKPEYGQNENVTLLNLQERTIYPADSLTDLAVFLIGDVINQYKNVNRPLMVVPFEESLIPSDSVFSTIGSLEDVFMIGYPHGLLDPYNNLPIARKGITSTPLYLKYDNKDEFLVDIANFNGSSGSPIVLYNPITLNNNGIFLGARLLLVGINHEAFFYNYIGQVVKEDPASYSGDRIKTLFPINIAIAIRSDKILEFKELIKQRIEREKRSNN